MMNSKEIASKFGISLDNDDFKTTKTLLSEDCKYDIGSKVLVGPNDIAGSYEENMIDGRKKFDELKWGESWIEELSENTYYVHFTDYLKHKGKSYIHKCKQRLVVENDKIVEIIHINDEKENDRIRAYYKEVGLL